MQLFFTSIPEKPKTIKEIIKSKLITHDNPPNSGLSGRSRSTKVHFMSPNCRPVKYSIGN